MALTVKLLLLGETLNGAPDMAVGMTSLLARDEAKLLLSWLAIGEAAVAI
jgi:hypothetical protein